MAIGLKVRTSILVAFISLLSLASLGQNFRVDSARYFNPLTEDITKRLPPLRVLTDSAAYNSPSMLYEDLKVDYYRYEEISAAREWLEYFSLNMDVIGGRWSYHDRDEITRVDRYYLTESWRTTLAGMFYIRLPIGALVDRRNRINKQKKWVEISIAQKEINKRYLQERVIVVYNDLVNLQAQIRIYNEYESFTMMQMQMAQNEFLNGEITTAEYTRLKEIQIKGTVLYQQSIAEFNKNYQVLQVITGMRFNLINVLR